MINNMKNEELVKLVYGMYKDVMALSEAEFAEFEKYMKKCPSGDSKLLVEALRTCREH